MVPHSIEILYNTPPATPYKNNNNEVCLILVSTNNNCRPPNEHKII